MAGAQQMAAASAVATIPVLSMVTVVLLVVLHFFDKPAALEVE